MCDGVSAFVHHLISAAVAPYTAIAPGIEVSPEFRDTDWTRNGSPANRAGGCRRRQMKADANAGCSSRAHGVGPASLDSLLMFFVCSVCSFESDPSPRSRWLIRISRAVASQIPFLPSFKVAYGDGCHDRERRMHKSQRLIVSGAERRGNRRHFIEAPGRTAYLIANIRHPFANGIMQSITQTYPWPEQGTTADSALLSPAQAHHHTSIGKSKCVVWTLPKWAISSIFQIPSIVVICC